MKISNSSIIPLEPDTQKELEAVLKSGKPAKVMLEGSDMVFIMQKEGIVTDGVADQITDFFQIYKLKDQSNEVIETYRKTMSAGTKGSARRKRRIVALVNYIKQT